eukprot:2157463-Pyramimonas_sp.AAC.1
MSMRSRRELEIEMEMMIYFGPLATPSASSSSTAAPARPAAGAAASSSAAAAAGTSATGAVPATGSRSAAANKDVCRACNSNRSAHDPTHTRRGPCKRPNVRAIGDECPGCKAGKPRKHGSHTGDERCRWELAAH